MSTSTAPTSRIEDAELGVALVGDLLRRAREGRFQVARLTDEEITVLDGADSPQVAPRPWFSGIGDAEHELVLAVAIRGLAARGLVQPSLVEESTGRMSIELSDDVHALLIARRAARSMVIAERKTAHASWFKVAYVQGEAGVVEEDVSPGGLHVFTVGPTASLIDSLVTFADPEGIAADEPGEQGREVALSDLATGTDSVGELSQSRYVTVVTVLSVGEDGADSSRRLTVYAGAEGVELARLVSDGRKALAVTPASAAGLRAEIDVLVSGVNR